MGILVHKYGCRPVTMICAFITGVALFLTAFTLNIYMVYVTFALAGELQLLCLIITMNMLLCNLDLVILKIARKTCRSTCVYDTLMLGFATRIMLIFSSSRIAAISTCCLFKTLEPHLLWYTHSIA